MCGIFGALSLSGDKPIDEIRFKSALGSIRHRGPDAEKTQRFGGHLMLGHTRLSIIDLATESDQPLSVHERYWIVYNGEIFNFVELRAELQSMGVTFKTHGDTEVLLQAYVTWGESCVQRFNGMWSFAIWDTVQRTLFCSRDRFGEKPFNYALHDGVFIFGSEIKPLLGYFPALAQPNLNAIANFCRTSVGAQHEDTWFKQVHRLQPGHNLVVKNGQITIRRYWHYPLRTAPGTAVPGFDDAREHYRELFTDAVRVRMRSDVPVGLTLSSGIDSTSIACLMQQVVPDRHHSFTAGFDSSQYQSSEFAPYADRTGVIDEASIATRLAGEINLQAHVISTDYGDLVGSLSHVIHHLESGNSSPAVLPLMQVMARARTQVKVLLEGQGADELLGGYIVSSIWPSIADLLAEGRLAEAKRSLQGFMEGHALSYSMKIAVRNLSNSLHLLSVLHQRASGMDSVYGAGLRDYQRLRDYPATGDAESTQVLSRQLQHQHSGGLVNLLHYGDALSMAHGIESRMPFLDHRLVEFVWPLPSSYKVHRGTGKYLHRQAMRSILPSYILDQKTKLGFTTPIAQQFKSVSGSGTDPADVLLSNRCLERGLFERHGLERILGDHRASRADHGNLLYRLLSVELWFRAFIDTASQAGAGST
jgi:asparagine synthase (glutamine-hydrolysing)